MLHEPGLGGHVARSIEKAFPVLACKHCPLPIEIRLICVQPGGRAEGRRCLRGRAAGPADQYRRTRSRSPGSTKPSSVIPWRRPFSIAPASSRFAGDASLLEFDGLAAPYFAAVVEYIRERVGDYFRERLAEKSSELI